MTNPQKNRQGTISFKKAMEFTSEYFIKSDERYLAWLLLSGSIISVIALVALMAGFSSISTIFWAALTAKDLPLFISSLQTFTLTLVGYIGVNITQNYLVDLLGIRWRNWITQTLIKKYTTGENNYLDLMRLSNQIENPEQRIQENVKSFVHMSLSLSLNFINSILSLATFVGTLWVVGGSLSFVMLGASITIPGYLVLCATFLTLTASWITHKIGSNLTVFVNKQAGFEADFRNEMEQLKENAESIAQDRGETYYQTLLYKKFQLIIEESYKILQIKTNLVAFQSFYQQISSLIPYIFSAPLYFSGRIDLGQLMQISFAFGEVQRSLGWFMDSYEQISIYQASIERLMALEDAFNTNGLTHYPKKIVLEEKSSTNEFKITDLDLAYPTNDTSLIMSKLNLTFKQGENTLVKGPSGLGKSTLFKVVAGTWKYGSGKVSCPTKDKICFLPQAPSLLNDTLRANLAYPESIHSYTDAQYIQVLQQIGNMEQFIDDLDVIDSWSTRLSGGQKQRISFARALLKKPDWLFLDEATAALDADSEKHLYGFLNTILNNTTVISIAHRNLDAFHDRIITFEASGNQEMKYGDYQGRLFKNPAEIETPLPQSPTYVWTLNNA